MAAVPNALGGAPEWAALLSETHDIVSLVGADRRQLWVSPALERVLGYREVPPSFPAGFVHPDDVAGLIETFDRMVAADEPSATARYRVRHADGRWRWVEAIGRNLLADPRIGAVVAVTRDITAREPVEALPPPSSPIADPVGWARMMRRAPQPTVVHSDGVVRWANEAAAALFELDPEAGVGMSLGAFVPAESEAVVVRRIAAVLAGGSAPTDEVVLRTASGRPIVVETQATRTTWQGRPAVHLAIWDVTSRRALADRLAWEATHDALTGLPNRVLFADRLRHALGGLRHEPGCVWVLFVDLDGYKAVNDSLGHLAGDEVLRTVARRLVGAVRPVDTMARYGGDEFVAVGVSPADGVDAAVAATARRIEAAVARPVTVGLDVAAVTASVGAATTFDAAADPLELLRAADQAAYRVKAAARRGRRALD